MRNPDRTAEEEQSPFMTPGEAAAALKISSKTLYRRLEDGTIPGIKIGSIWRCRRDRIMTLGLETNSADKERRQT